MFIALKLKNATKLVFALLLTCVCLFWPFVRKCPFFRNVAAETEFLFLRPDTQWILFVCVVVLVFGFIGMRYGRDDILLMPLILGVVVEYAVDYSACYRPPRAIALLAGLAIGKVIRVLLVDGGNSKSGEPHLTQLNYYRVGFVTLLVFSAPWHLTPDPSVYTGPRWTGVIDNPNDYGLQMGCGLVLLTAFLQRKKIGHSTTKIFATPTQRKICIVAVKIAISCGLCVMITGILFSSSRGAWIGTFVGLCYLSKAYLRKYYHILLSAMFIAGLSVLWLSYSMRDMTRWNIGRLNFGNASVQHRIAAYKGACRMLHDFPFGLGWNQAIRVYTTDYSAPLNGGGALSTNDYLMIACELGIPTALCFFLFIARLYKNVSKNTICTTAFLHRRGYYPIENACRAAILVLIVGFWFDGGLFKIPLATTFWILVELASVRENREIGSSSGNA